MVNFRLYRPALAAPACALVALMFSLEGVPEPLEPAVSPATFEAGRAAATARQIVDAAQERAPGSEGDAAGADLVARRFAEIPAGTVSEQTVSASFDGEEVETRNVLITLPGESPVTIVVLAGRDAARGSGAASSAAATGVLTELAAALGVAGHRKTYVVASTSGAAEGAAGARQLLGALADPSAVEAVVVISQPGAAERSRPFVVTSSTDSGRTAIQLARTAAEAVEVQAQEPGDDSQIFGQIARLAIPAGLGEQAPLIGAGADAVAISSAGERPLEPEADQPEDVSVATLGDFGRAAQSTVQAIDAADSPLEHGPSSYVEAGGNLVPGWTLALLGMALLLPAAVAAVDTLARASRRPQRLGASVLWVAGWSAPLLAGLVALYGLALVGVIARPEFPFDPGRYEIGIAAGVAFVLCCAAVAGGGLAVRRFERASRPARGPLVAGLGAVSVAAGLLAWLSNPYLGLLIAPAAHVWLLASGPPGRLRAVATIVAGVAALLPLLFALGHLASVLELGADAPWTFMLLLADGQIGLASAVAICLLCGSLAAVTASAVQATIHARDAYADPVR